VGTGLSSTIGVDTATTLPTAMNVAASGKSAYVQLAASTTFTSTRVVSNLSAIKAITGLEVTGLFDLAVGAAASEVVVIPNMLFSGNSANDIQSPYDFPLTIASGSRVASRGGYGGTVTVYISVWLFAPDSVAGCPTSGAVTTYGAVEAPGTGINSFHGTQIDPGTTAHTKGAWTELTASSGAHDWLTVAVGRSMNDGADDYGRWFDDIGTGAAGSETVVVADLPFDQVCSGTFVSGGPINWSPVGPLPVTIAAGTRLAVRAQSNLTTEVGFPNSTVLRRFDAVLYGVIP